jgi:hypothetical protein
MWAHQSRPISGSGLLANEIYTVPVLCLKRQPAEPARYRLLLTRAPLIRNGV